MRDTYTTAETYAFTCVDCGHRWTLRYEARHSQDPEGAELCVWSRGGYPSAAPDAGVPCPVCGGVRARSALVHRL